MLLFAVIGKPVGHSLSPQMHRAAFRALGLRAEYTRIECEPHELAGLAEAVRAGALAGANITLPYKSAAYQLADAASDEARVLGAANTWALDAGKLVAYNTDVQGFLTGLQNVQLPQEGAAVVLGSGGAARAVCFALKRLSRDVLVLARHPEQAAGALRGLDCRIESWNEETALRAAPDAALVVNATPLGMEPATDTMPPFPLGNLRPDAVVYDIVYRPRRTLWLRSAEELGLATVGGIGMLVGQGVASFELWFGKKAPFDEMLLAVEFALDPCS